MTKSGDSLVLVFNGGNSPKLANVRVEQPDPLTVLLPGAEWAEELEVGSRVSLIAREENQGAHSDATVGEITKYGLSLVVQLNGLEWTTFDRRRAPRYPVDLNSEVTLVSDDTGTAEVDHVTCSVVDISSVGCRLATDKAIPPGVLVAAAIQPQGGGEPFRTLAIVTRTLSDPDGFAIEFFDYMGTTRFRLNEFLTSLAPAA